MKYRMPDGVVISGETHTQIVEQMAGHKLTEPRSLATYRHETASRVADMYEMIVDATDDSSFVTSLEAMGLMERLP